MPQPRRQTILVFDANRAIARLIQSYLEAAGFHVPRPSLTVSDALASATSTAPDCVVMDLALADESGAVHELTAALTARRVPIVYVVSNVDRATVERAADHAAAGCVVRPIAERQLVTTVLFATTAARRSPTLTDVPQRMTSDEKLRLIAAVASDVPVDDDHRAAPRHHAGAARPPERLDPLTARERQIVDLLANGARVVTIAQRLQISSHTVRNHLKSVFKKLNLSGQHELFEYWHEHAG